MQPATAAIWSLSVPEIVPADFISTGEKSGVDLHLVSNDRRLSLIPVQ